jgi:hypothetical protein
VTPEAGRVTGVVDACAQRGVGPVLDELALSKITEANARPVSDRIVGGDRQLQRFGGDRAGSDPVGLRAEWQVNDREFDLAVRRASHELGRANVVDPQSHGRVPAVKAGEQNGQVDPIKRLDGPDREVAAHQAADGCNRVQAVLGRYDRAPGSWEQGPTGLGQCDLSRAADEQVAAKFTLKSAHRARQIRLRKVHPRCRAREVALFGDRQKVGELP